MTAGLVATTAAAAAVPGVPAAVSLSASLSTGAFAAPTLQAGGEALSTTTEEAEEILAGARAALRSATAVEAEAATSPRELEISPSVDTAPLRDAVARLDGATFVPVLLFPELTEDAAAETSRVEERVAEVAAALEKARAQQAAADAAAEAQRQAQAQAAAEAQRQAELLAAANTPDGAKAVAQQMAAERFGWGGDQFSCLVSLWQKESNWNYQAYNSSSGATGIPQALPGSKMATAGADWQSSAATQIAWGLDYIDRAYGTPCAAWGHSQATNWY